MLSHERFLSAMTYKGYDRPPTHYYTYSAPEINDALFRELRVKSHDELLSALGVDFRYINLSYIGPELRKFEDGTWEGLWGERYMNYHFGTGSYAETCYLPFADIESIEELKRYRFPSADWYDYSGLYDQCIRHKGKVRLFGSAQNPDFINGIARCRGVEQVLLDIGDENEVYLELMRRQFEFLLERNRRALEAARGEIDVMCFGEDLGDQRGLLMRPAVYDKLFAPYMRELFAQAHSYGAYTMMHSCGSVYRIIPRLIEMGLDILEVVQTDANEMEITRLHDDFFGKIAFFGTMSVQTTLPFGTPESIREEVSLRKKLFRQGGIVIAPSHGIQVGTPVENILAMYEEIGSFDRWAWQHRLPARKSS